MRQSTKGRGCGRLLGYFVAAMMGWILPAVLIPPEHFLLTLLISIPAFLASAVLFFLGFTRLFGLDADSKSQVIRRHPLSPWEETHYRMFGGWVCPTCGRLNPSTNKACYSCGRARHQRSYAQAARRERTASYAPPGVEAHWRPSDTRRYIMEELTKRSRWSYDRFRRVLIASAALEHDIPAAHRPDSIDLGKLAKHIGVLTAKCTQDGREWCRVFLVDIERQILLRGKTTCGDPRSVLTDWSKQPGREAVQRRSFSIHTHPLSMTPVAQGFSDTDYGTFLWDREQRAMIMGCGDSVLMILQTTATPIASSPDKIKESIDAIEEETLGGATGRSLTQGLVDFNREVCIQFGLILYVGGEDGQMQWTQVV